MTLSSKRRADLMSGPYTKLLAEHEELLAELYKCFAVAIPDAKDFWEKMAEEELSHLKLIRGVEEKIHGHMWAFARPEFTTKTIADACDRITAKCQSVANDGISMREALQYAIELERSLIEAEFFQVIECDNAKMINVLQSLASYTYAHAQSLEKEAKRMKWKFSGGKRSKDFKNIVLTKGSVQENVKAVQSKLIGNIIALEEAAAGLYHTFSLRLDVESNFWAKLAAEERQHAAMLRKLYELLDQGRVFYNVARFSNEEMLKDIDKVLGYEFDARRGKLSLYTAVNTALEVERLIAEGSFYSTVDSDAPEFKYIAERMIKETKEHVRRLQDEVGRAIDMGVLAAKPAKTLQE